MTIQNAIKKAIEGGWTSKEVYECEIEGIPVVHNGFLLDPLFWQALGKSMWWDDKKCFSCGYFGNLNKHNTRSNTNSDSGVFIERESRKENWLYHWHSLIDSLAEGKTIEQFFASLLETK